jgi:diaminopimelate decarboxylase
LADQVGTPFYLYDAGILRARLGELQALTEGAALQARYAMKANSAAKVLELIRDAGLWIDAVSGNEVLRARRAGFAMGATPPVVMLTADVFRDNALTVVLEHNVLPNIGYRGPLAVRFNPGFGHG